MRAAIVISFIAMLVATAVQAQQQQQLNAPRAGYVYPAGGQQGTTFQAVVGGQFLNGVARAFVSGSGVHVRVLAHDRPVTGQALTALRDRVRTLQQELQKKVGADLARQKEIADLRFRIGDSQRRSANPAISETVTLEISIASNAEPGDRRLRLDTPIGLTNPLILCVGQLPEFRENDVKKSKADMELAVTLPAIVNGRLIPGDIDRIDFPLRAPPQYMPGDVDRYRFQARRGQQLIAAVSARHLIPFLADAVPGWFQATLALFDADGRELAYSDDYLFHPDPVIHYEIPADGEYVLEIKDAIYRGREDFVYRIAIGELPYVTGIFPLGGRSGVRTDVELRGWNLASNRFPMDARNKVPGSYPDLISGAGVQSNPLPFAVDTLREVLEAKPNNSIQQAQEITLPVIINGRVDEPGQRDVFSFKGRAGDVIVAEVHARRLQSPLDAVLELTDASGRRVAWNDDYEDKGAGAGLETHHADSRVTAKLPVTGIYYVRLGDVQRRGGTDYAYRLRIGAPRPDFELRISPSSISAGGGGTVPLTVTALRRDGLDGDIVIALKDAPGGFVLSGALLPAGQNRVRMTLTVPAIAGRNSQANALRAPVILKFEGRAVINGRSVVRQALPADDMMQAFAYQHLVLADDFWVSVIGRGATRAPSSIISAQPVRIRAGGTAQVRIAIPQLYRSFAKLQFQLSEPQEGVTISNQLLNATGASLVLAIDAAKLKAGQRGNLIVEISGERVPAPNAPATQLPRRVQVGILPAIAFEVIR